ncbi:tyrosine-type recombinase/integrase [Nocardia sp. NPDC058633]|uniref:tyrosine-type recombinase/integrase n=1 Tax=Nocardia sp. NPDC058633 TaxID=3346568 RepID=UPI0036676EC5
MVTVSEDGKPIRPEWFTDWFQRQAKAAGVPVTRLHDARHTAATILLDSGVSVAPAAKWLGHGPAILLRCYARRRRGDGSGSTVRRAETGRWRVI